MILTKRIGIGLCLLWLCTLGWARPNPSDTLNQVAQQTIQQLKTNKATLKTNPTVVYQIINRVLLPHVERAAMSRTALGRNAWMSATPQQQKAFMQEFTNQLVRTYASALANYTDEQIKFLPLRVDYNQVNQLTVDSNIVRPDGPAIRLSYQVIWSGGDWKVYDMTVEGVSLLQSFRAEFAQELSQGNLEQLINKLRQRNVGMRN